MTIDIPGDKVFVQRDVRETPAATATATSVGLTTPQYLTLALDADLVNERVLTAGEGIDFTDTGANGTLTINGELATDTGNKGISTFTASDFDVASGVVTIDDSGVDHDGTTNFLVAEHRNWESSIAQNIHADNYTDTGDTTYTAGEGLDLVGTVFSGENASDSGNKGIASFNPSDFDVTNGAVSIDDSGIDHGAIGNTHNMTTDIDARMTAGEGINYVAGTISAETASETNRGIATFDGTDFNVNTGDVTLKATVLMSIDGDSGTATPSVHNIDILGGDGISTVGASNDITITNSDHAAVGTNSTHVGGDGSDHEDVAANTALLANKNGYWTCPGNHFSTQTPPTDTIFYQDSADTNEGSAMGVGNNARYFAAVVGLPHNAVVTGVEVWGDATTNFHLYRTRLRNPDGNVSEMASGVVGTQDTSINNATIDGSIYIYWIEVDDVDEGEYVYGAQIRYTTDYD